MLLEKNNEKESEEFYRDDPIDWRYFVYYHNDNHIAFTELPLFCLADLSAGKI